VEPWTDGQRAPNGRDTINGQATLTLARCPLPTGNAQPTGTQRVSTGNGQATRTRCPLPVANGQRATNGQATRTNRQKVSQQAVKRALSCKS